LNSVVSLRRLGKVLTHICFSDAHEPKNDSITKKQGDRKTDFKALLRESSNRRRPLKAAGSKGDRDKTKQGK